MPFCSVGGHRIHYIMYGELLPDSRLPVLVFLHEGLGSIPQWKDFPEKMGNILGLPILLYERYGYGKSDKLIDRRRGNFAWTAATEELPALLDALNIKSPLFLIGHSDGATIALMYASVFQDRVLGVVSEAAHVMLEDISRSGIKNTIELFETTRLREFLERYHGDRTESMFYGWAHTWISSEMDEWDMKEDLKKICAPVLAIQGEDDEYGSFEQLNWIRQFCQGETELMFLPECGHIPHFQQQEIVSEAITRFILKYLPNESKD